MITSNQEENVTIQQVKENKGTIRKVVLIIEDNTHNIDNVCCAEIICEALENSNYHPEKIISIHVTELPEDDVILQYNKKRNTAYNYNAE
jgi:hypothetical protein